MSEPLVDGVLLGDGSWEVLECGWVWKHWVRSCRILLGSTLTPLWNVFLGSLAVLLASVLHWSESPGVLLQTCY